MAQKPTARPFPALLQEAERETFENANPDASGCTISHIRRQFGNSLSREQQAVLALLAAINAGLLQSDPQHSGIFIPPARIQPLDHAKEQLRKEDFDRLEQAITEAQDLIIARKVRDLLENTYFYLKDQIMSDRKAG